MTQIERLACRLLLKEKLTELYGNSFEDFFHDLMCSRYPDFLDVRTAGSLGDQGSDGLSLHGHKLYACYAPRTFNRRNVEEKFHSDVRSALDQRESEFNVFVFVHNDQRGLHPEVASLLAEARTDYHPVQFEAFGHRRFRDEILKLSKTQVEDLLGRLPVEEMVYGVTLEEMQPLLEHLQRQRKPARLNEPIPAVSEKKLSFNDFDADIRDLLRGSMHRSADIEEYYNSRIDLLERDEAAAGFREEYERIRESTGNPDDILLQLEHYVLGNRLPSLRDRFAVTAVLAYFFQTCDIFDDAPPGWNEPEDTLEESA